MSAALIDQIEIIKEEKDYLVILKPSGIHSVDLEKSKAASVAGWLRKTFPETDQASMRKEDSGLVQRLDHETSGLLLAARNREAWLKINVALKNSKIDKEYVVLVEGKTEASFNVRAYIGSPNRRAEKVRVYDDKPKKSSRALWGETSFKLIKYVPEIDASVLRATCHAARRHQIRAHASHTGHPLMGDSLYGSKTKLQEKLKRECPTFILHACGLRFEDPSNGKQVTCQAEMPDYVAGLISG